MRATRLTPQERNDLLFISRLQKLNCYGQIVRRLTEGHSVRSVARWLQTLQIDGPAGQWSQTYWRHLLDPLAKQVKAAKEKAFRAERRRTAHPAEPTVEAVEAVLAEVVTPNSLLREAMPPSASEVWKHVDETVETLKAERILKYAFFRQQGRVENLIDIETKMKILLPSGDRAIAELRKIGEAIGKGRYSRIREFACE